jgi:hypothetical protein
LTTLWQYAILRMRLREFVKRVLTRHRQCVILLMKGEAMDKIVTITGKELIDIAAKDFHLYNTPGTESLYWADYPKNKHDTDLINVEWLLYVNYMESVDEVVPENEYTVIIRKSTCTICGKIIMTTAYNDSQSGKSFGKYGYCWECVWRYF